jgi:hypothetical protein
VHVHDPVKEALGRDRRPPFLHLGDDVEVHAPGKGSFLARGDDDALDRVIGQRVVDQRLDGGQPPRTFITFMDLPSMGCPR